VTIDGPASSAADSHSFKLVQLMEVTTPAEAALETTPTEANRTNAFMSLPLFPFLRM
jgi:hypothetical protein